jgi:hypothetical protein
MRDDLWEELPYRLRRGSLYKKLASRDEFLRGEGGNRPVELSYTSLRGLGILIVHPNEQGQSPKAALNLLGNP